MINKVNSVNLENIVLRHLGLTREKRRARGYFWLIELSLASSDPAGIHGLMPPSRMSSPPPRLPSYTSTETNTNSVTPRQAAEFFFLSLSDQESRDASCLKKIDLNKNAALKWIRLYVHETKTVWARFSLVKSAFWQKWKHRTTPNCRCWHAVKIKEAKRDFLTAINFPSVTSLSSVVSLPSHICFCTSFPFSRVTTVCKINEETHPLTPNGTVPKCQLTVHPKSALTLVFLSSAVVSSNSSFNLNLISVVLKVLCDFRHIIPWPSTLTTRFGLVLFPTWRVAKPTPAN